MKKLVLIGMVLAAVLVIVGYKLYNKDHRSVEDETAIVLNASDLFGEYEANETEANTKYLDKVLEVTGTVSEIITNQDGKSVIILSTSNPMFGINCTMEGDSENISVGSTVSIKGICTGYLSDVVITRGVATKK
jgi:ATP-dependent 26S proteasome regulatory subunit